MGSEIRIAIDARIDQPGRSGGIEQVILGLANGFSGLADGNERYFFLTYEDLLPWIQPHLGGACEVLPCKRSWSRSWRTTVSSRAPVIRRLLETLGLLLGDRAFSIPRSDGTIERANIDLVHFPRQAAFLTDIPSIYHPHDLQHVHLPQMFSAYERRGRSLLYKTFSEKASLVAVASSWVRDDIVHHLDLDPRSVAVVPLAAATAAYDRPTDIEIAETKRKYGLPEKFLFYPAQTWPHKNHESLLRAIHLIARQNGLTIPVVFSGRLSEFRSRLDELAAQLRIRQQIKYLGFVSATELQALYSLSHCVVIPSLFEAASFPVFEAFAAGSPTASSNVTSLPKQAGDAALIFDPHNIEEIAGAILQLWSDDQLRTRLVARGRQRVAQFSWTRTCRHFRAHYRRILKCPLSEADESLLMKTDLL